MIFFKSKTRKRVELELMKLYKQLAEVRVAKKNSRPFDTKTQFDFIMREHEIESKIELYKKLLK